MGDHQGWAQPSGLLPNGLLPNQAYGVTKVLDVERWSEAEERTSELIACIQPNQPSEERRNAVAYYVQRLIMKCFSCEVFTFGSVPLKTYLPDGDIDLTAFSTNQNLKDTWAQDVRDMLEKEEKSDTAEFNVKEVQYIQAEVKIIKCLVENIVVDISFNQLGGLCTLCFLDEVDKLINQNHLFKRSIILIKAWCYYESRILGAHHGLISTYALETLVLYIFHVFNNSFRGPLEVLYRFLEFFSNFDWDNLCVSLWGPVPISSLPEMTAEPPRRDDGELLLSKPFLDDCNLKYAVFPGGQETQGQPFVSKHFNVIDPLRTNNNLGRSVSKGNFFRIRSAFAFGAKRLARLLECPKDSIMIEVDEFFMNTWDRHGSGHRPDAPCPVLCPGRPLNQVFSDGPVKSHSSLRRKGENARSATSHKSQVDGTVAFNGITSQLGSNMGQNTETLLKTSNMPSASRSQSHMMYTNQNNSRISDQVARDISSSEALRPEKGQRSSRQDYLVKEREGQGRYFPRTQSSPELADMCNDVFSQGKQNRIHGTGKSQLSSAKPDHSFRKRNIGSEISTSHSTRSSKDSQSSLRQSSSHQSLDATADSNSYHDDASCLAPIGEEFSSLTETIDMQQQDMMPQQEQNLINMMSSSRIHNSSDQVQSPLNFPSPHMPVPFPPVLASMEYAQRNLPGIVPAANIHLFEPNWGNNIHFMQNLVSTPIPPNFSAGPATSSEEINESVNDDSGLAELNQEDGNDFWHQHQEGHSRGFNATNGNFQSQISSSLNSFIKGQQKLMKDNQSTTREDHYDISQHQNKTGNDYSDRNINSRLFPGTQGSSSRTKLVSDPSWEGSSMRPLKPGRDKRGKKVASAISSTYRKARTVGWHHESSLSDHTSSLPDEDNREWIPISPVGGTELEEDSMMPLSATTTYVRDQQLSNYEPTNISESDSMMPISPMLAGSNSRHKTIDNNGSMPLTFYPTGPPVPFLTMLPVYNFPAEAGNSGGSSRHYDEEDDIKGSCINQPDQNLRLSERIDQSEVSSSPARAALVEPSEQPKPDILHSDFLSHLQNLQYGRLCQNTRNHMPWIYPSSVMVPPIYLQGHFPWDGPGRPLIGNVNLFTQIMSYAGPRLVPVASLQSSSKRPVGVSQRFVDNPSRYRTGTGTYLPNPKVNFRDRQSNTKNHRGNFINERSEHGSREGTWNFASKSHSSSHGHGRVQSEKSNSRLDRLTAADSHADRPWESCREESVASYQGQNGPFSFTNSISSASGVSYGMYPVPPINSNDVNPTGSAVPSVVMLYPYDHNVGFGSQAEPLEFGSLGPVHLSGMNEALHLGDNGQLRSAYEHRQRAFRGSSARSPDQPSSPQLRREV